MASSQKIVNNRVDYSKVSGKLEMPYLVEIQINSYKEFLEKGIDETLKSFFPISAGKLSLSYNGCKLDKVNYSPSECKARNVNYFKKLYVDLTLLRSSGELITKSIYMGDIPIMTESGTFIINGSERAIISQIVRSPGSYVIDDGYDLKGNHLYRNDLIPDRGNYLQLENTSKSHIDMRINRQKKMPSVLLFYALGLQTESAMKEIFGNNKYFLNSLTDVKKGTQDSTAALREIFKRLKSGEPVTDEGSYTYIKGVYFDDHRYDLGRAGRYKLTKKLCAYNRLVDKILAEDLVDENENVLFKKGVTLTKKDIEELKEKKYFNKNHRFAVNIDPRVREKIDNHNVVNIVKIFKDETKKEIINIVGLDPKLEDQHINCLTISDVLATYSNFLNVLDGVAKCDDIDNLSNRRIRSVGELLQNSFHQGLVTVKKTIEQKMAVADPETAKIPNLINIKPVNSAVHDFFSTSPLSSFMDQTNPLAELTNKRRISALGPGGISRDRSVGEVRDVHYTHYGRICPIETPEGQTIGLINSFASYAKVDKYGFIETPYRKVLHENGKAIVTDESIYFSTDDERDYVICGANVNLNEKNEITDKYVIARYNGENIVAPTKNVDFIDVTPKQIVSVAAACIPFLESDDTTRALMGANMQRQALPLLKPEAPFVGTGVENRIARDSGLAVVARDDGEITYVDSTKIEVKYDTLGKVIIPLQKFERSNKSTCINQQAIVKVHDRIKKNQIIADGPAMQGGDLALGQNVTIAFMTWNGYNYEDAVIMSERLMKDDSYTSIHIEEYSIECRTTKNGDEDITREIPNVGEDAKKHLDDNGIITVGSEVKEGDILVGKTTPRGYSEPSPTDKLLMNLFGSKGRDGKDSSLRVPHGGAGIVIDVKRFVRPRDTLAPQVNQQIFVYVAQKRKISEGDKMSGRHGNKGVISRILPVEDMPFLPDGTPVDIMLNPLGVPSRMNIGQVLEIHLGLACKKLGMKISTPVFDGIDDKEIRRLMDEAKIAKDGKTVLYDGRTGERFDERISVGVMYMIKLDHMVDDKLHARATGPYSVVTQQPLGGKAQNGGQRFGEMEVWALEAYGAANILQEMLTIKSDDRVGRNKAYEAIIKHEKLPQPGIPEAFRVLVKELQALCINVNLLDKNDNEIDMNALAEEVRKEETRASSIIRSITSTDASDEPITVTKAELEDDIEK